MSAVGYAVGAAGHPYGALFTSSSVGRFSKFPILGNFAEIGKSRLRPSGRKPTGSPGGQPKPTMNPSRERWEPPPKREADASSSPWDSRGNFRQVTFSKLADFVVLGLVLLARQWKGVIYLLLVHFHAGVEGRSRRSAFWLSVILVDCVVVVERQPLLLECFLHLGSNAHP